MRVRQFNLYDFIAIVMIDNPIGRKIGPTRNEHYRRAETVRYWFV